MNKKYLVVIFASIIGLSVLLFFVLDNKHQKVVIPIGGDHLVGGDSDQHGCKASAGYSWCETKSRCLRVWEEQCPGSDAGKEECVVENCHGLEISCGTHLPEACTAMYALGDKCLKYAQCGIDAGRCRQIENPKFSACKSCVKNCLEKNENDVVGSFECESKCE